jgi:signal peptidase I
MGSLISMKVVLVTRSILPPKVGDVVFFDPPPSIDEAIANSKIGRAAKTASNDVDGTPAVSVVSTKGKQFIKRVVGVPGDTVGVYNSNPYVALCNNNSNECKFRVDRTGEYSKPDVFPDQSWNRITPTINTNLGDAEDKDQTSVLGKNEYFVAGDNGFRSVDSRVWGPLDRHYIFGTAQCVIFPPEHFGRIASGNMAISEVLQ